MNEPKPNGQAEASFAPCPGSEKPRREDVAWQLDEAMAVLSNQDALRTHILRTMSADSIAHLLGEEAAKVLRQRDRLRAALKALIDAPDYRKLSEFSPEELAAWAEAREAVAAVNGSAS